MLSTQMLSALAVMPGASVELMKTTSIRDLVVNQHSVTGPSLDTISTRQRNIYHALNSQE